MEGNDPLAAIMQHALTRLCIVLTGGNMQERLSDGIHSHTESLQSTEYSETDIAVKVLHRRRRAGRAC